MLGLALVPPVALAIALERLQPGTEAGFLTTLAKVAAVVLVWTVAVLIGWHHGGWKTAIRSPHR